MQLKSPLPVIDGVAACRIHLPSGNWKTILDFLTEKFHHTSEADWNSRLSRGIIIESSGRCLKSTSPYCSGSTIFYYREIRQETAIPYIEQILYQDEHLLVVDKPHFLPVQPAGRFLQETLLVRLRNSGQPEDLVPLHRLDRETAGVMIFSRCLASRGRYAVLWQNRRVEKIYEAIAPLEQGLELPLTRCTRIVKGQPFFRMQEVNGTPNSCTQIELMNKLGNKGRYRVQLLTGRKHQIRLHFAALGIPLLNDNLYPNLQHVEVGDYSKPLKLLSKTISFIDPLTGQHHSFASKQRLDLA